MKNVENEVRMRILRILQERLVFMHEVRATHDAHQVVEGDTWHHKFWTRVRQILELFSTSMGRPSLARRIILV